MTLIRGSTEYKALMDAAMTTPPPCADDHRFIREPDELAPVELDDMARICWGCPIFVACKAYGDVGRPTGGYWAGRHYNAPKRRTTKGKTNG